MTQGSTGRAAPSTPRWLRRSAALPVVLMLLAAAACGDGKPSDDTQAPSAAAPAGDGAGGAEASPAAADPAATAAQPSAPTDPAASAIADSIHEAQLYHKRMASMESYASCMEKTKGVDGPQRAVLETACRRARGAPR